MFGWSQEFFCQSILGLKSDNGIFSGTEVVI
jgi:hypothetical protein